MSYSKNVDKTFDIEKDILLTKLIEIPYTSKDSQISSELIINDGPKSEVLKSFKSLKTNIQFLNVNNKTEKTILITSPYKQEGKSYIVANLAIVYSEIGKKVLIIDADLKNGRQSLIFNIPNVLGFSNLLSGLDNDGLEMDISVNKFINDTSIKNISLITSGIVPPNPAELLSSKKFPEIIEELSKIYDIILIDGTSILLSEDSLILSRRVGTTIIVSDNNTKKEELIQTKKDIQNVGGRIIGVICNKVGTIRPQKVNLFKLLGNKILSFFKNIFTKIKSVVQDRKQKLLDKGIEEDYIIDNNIEIQKKEISEKAITKKEIEKKEIIEKQIDKTELGKKGTNKKLINNKEINKKEVNEKEKNKNETDKIETIEKVVETVPNIQKEIPQEPNVENEEEKDIIKPVIVLKELSHKIIGKVNSNKKESKSSKQKKSNSSNIELFKEDIIENNKEIEDYYNSNKDKEFKQKQIVDSNVEVDEKTVLVIVDELNGVCRAFNKDCYTEKLARGLDKSDGFVKAYYSPYFMKKRIEGLMNLYNISKKQAKKIDPLVYGTLCDFDECIWLEKKIDLDLSGIYVKCMTIDFEKQPTEGLIKYKNRCKRLRKEALKKLNIEIEYSLNNGAKSNNLTFIDKLEMKKFSKFLEYEEEKVENENSNESKQLPEETIEEVLVREKESLINKQKQYKEKQDEKKRKKELRDEKKKETEILRKIKKEKQNVKRREIKSKREMEKEERNRLREENRIKREYEREKLKEEARIEEELLGDNLYPKTKNNKDLL